MAIIPLPPFFTNHSADPSVKILIHEHFRYLWSKVSKVSVFSILGGMVSLRVGARDFC